MSTSIHPSAIVSPDAQLGDDVQIGPYAIVHEHSVLGDGTLIHAHATIGPYVKMGKANQVHSYTMIGSLPQDLSFDPASETGVTVGDHNDFREGVTISRATKNDANTQIGSHCFFMNHSHVGHDSVVGDHNIFANNVALGGHVEVGDRAFIGGGTAIHQFCRIGSFVMLSGVSGARKDVLPFTTGAGVPIIHYRLNSVGLRRAGITGANYSALNQAFRLMRTKQPLTELPDTPEIEYLRGWLAQDSKRGLSGFARTDK